jgi:hypothetical protein
MVDCCPPMLYLINVINPVVNKEINSDIEFINQIMYKKNIIIKSTKKVLLNNIKISLRL